MKKTLLFSVLGAFLVASAVVYSATGDLFNSNKNAQPVDKVELTIDWKAPKETLEQLVAESPLIVEGVVSESNSYFSNPNGKFGGVVFTDQVVNVVDVIKGDKNLKQVTVLQTGGTYDGKLYENHLDPLFQKGERYIFFLQPQKAKPNSTDLTGKYLRVVGPQGDYKIIDGKLNNNFELDPVKDELNGKTISEFLKTISPFLAKTAGMN
jgi:hypothetical protein